MNTDTLRLILQSAVAVMVGGGGLAFIRFLLERRPQLRKLDTAADVDQSTVSVNQSAIYKDMINQLQEDGAVLRDQLEKLQARFERLEDSHILEIRALTEQLRNAHAENTRLTTRVAQLQTDLDIAERQINELRTRQRRG